MTTMHCAAVGCPDPPRNRGYCERHYRRRLHTGRYGYRDAGPAREHVLKLRQLGWPYVLIAESAGTSSWVPHKLATGGVRRVLAETEKAILAVPLVPCPSHRSVDGTGTYRRWEGLQWMGWPAVDIASRIGVKPYTLGTMRCHGRQVSFRVACAMAEVYEELSHIPGPSKQTATKARRRGCAPPAAWDEDTIDDPNAQPDLGGDDGQVLDDVAIERVVRGILGDASKLTPAERREAAKRMASAGNSRTAMARRLRCSAGVLDRLLEAS